MILGWGADYADAASFFVPLLGTEQRCTGDELRPADDHGPDSGGEPAHWARPVGRPGPTWTSI